MNSKTKVNHILILLVLSFSILSTSSNAQNTSPSSIVILIDDAHGQFINSTLMTGAINSLENEGFKVIPLKEKITQQILNGVDLVIFPNPKTGDSYSAEEVFALSEWMSNEKDKGMILLSNPLDTINSSLDGAGKVFNDLLIAQGFSITQKFLITDGQSKDVLVKKYENSSSDYMGLNLKVLSNVTLPTNVSLTIQTKSTAVTVNDDQIILNAGFDSFYLTKDQKFLGQDVNNNLFGGISFKQGRIVLGGSTLMFSDLPNPYNSNTTWFNSAENKLFWDSLIKWSINFNIDSNLQELDFNFFLALTATTGTIGIVLIIAGMFMYATGKEMKIFEIDQNLLKNEEKAAQDDASNLTKSQKRLQQRNRSK
jgi:hypothetical protein